MRSIRAGLSLTLLVPLLAVLLVLGSSGAAEAAGVKYGPWVPGHFQEYVGGWSCSFDAQYVATSETSNSVRVANLGCDKGWSNAIFDNEPERSWVQLTFEGTTVTAATACAVSTAPIYGSTETFLSGASATAAGFGACQVSTVCYELYAAWNGLPDNTSTGCVDFEMGAPPSTVAPLRDCPFWSMTGVKLGDIKRPGFEETQYKSTATLLGMTWKTGGSVPGAMAQLRISPVIRTPDGTIKTWWTYLSASATYRSISNPGSYAESGSSYTRSDDPGPGGGAAQEGTRTQHLARIIGYQIYPADLQVGGPVDYQPLNRYSDATPLGIVGKTDLPNCVMYFGEKIAEVSGSTADDPLGPMTAPDGTVPDEGPAEPPAPVAPEPEPAESCTFSWSDPATWLEGGMCAVVGLLGGIWDTLRGLPGKIASGVLGGLSALFVPEDAPDFSDIDSPLKPGWVPSMPDLSDGDCGGVTMPRLQLGYAGWSVGPTEMFNTCDDPWPLVRTLTYYGSLALLLVTVVWQSFRAVSNALGMGVGGVSAGGDD